MPALDKNLIIDDLRAFLVDHFPKKSGLSSLKPEDNLQTVGIDSLDSIEVINHVEDKYGLKFDRFEGSYFDTLGRIAELVSKKTA